MNWKAWTISNIDRLLNLSPKRILTIYLFFGLSWILISDLLLYNIIVGHETFPKIHITKGILFVGVSSTLIFGLTKTRQISQDQTKRQLKNSNELLDVLSRILRHNMKNDMNTILLYSELLKDKDNIDIENYINKIIETSKDLVELSENTKHIAETLKKEDRLKKTNIKTILEKAIEANKQEHSKTSFYKKNIKNIDVLGNNSLEFVLTETIRNGIIHNNKGPEDRKIWINTKQKENKLTVEVSDNGPGIPKEETRPIQQGKETPLQHGSRLNLWLTNWTVNKLYGEIKYKENKHGGTTVEITLQLPTPELMEEIPIPPIQ